MLVLKVAVDAILLADVAIELTLLGLAFGNLLDKGLESAFSSFKMGVLPVVSVVSLLFGVF